MSAHSFALVIGIDRYPRLTGTPPAGTAAGHDALGWVEVCRDCLGIPHERLRVLVDSDVVIPEAAGAARTDVSEGLRWLAERLAEPGATGFLLYAGRGVGVGGVLALCPSDLGDDHAEALPLDALAAEGGFCAERLARLLVVLDTSSVPVAPTGLGARGLGGLGNAVVGLPRVLRASGEAEAALEIPVGTRRRGAFTYSLQAALREQARTAKAIDALVARCAALHESLGVAQRPEWNGEAGDVVTTPCDPFMGVGQQLDGNEQGFKAYILENGSTVVGRMIAIGLGVPQTANERYRNVDAFDKPQECWKLGTLSSLPSTLKFREIENIAWATLGPGLNDALDAWLAFGPPVRFAAPGANASWTPGCFYKGKTTDDEDYLLGLVTNAGGEIVQLRWHRATGTLGPLVIPTTAGNQIDASGSVPTAWKTHGGQL